MKKQPSPKLILDETAFPVHGYITAHAFDANTGEKQYIAFIFRDRVTRLHIAKDANGFEYLPRSENLEALKKQVIAHYANEHDQRIQRIPQNNTKAINR